jgi:hypothetical protein
MLVRKLLDKIRECGLTPDSERFPGCLLSIHKFSLVYASSTRGYLLLESR